MNRVDRGQPVTVDWSQTTKADLEVNGAIKVKNWSNNKTHIDDMEADYKSMR